MMRIIAMLKDITLRKASGIPGDFFFMYRKKN